MELCQLTIKEIQEGFKKKKFSSTELINSCLKQIKRLEPKLNAFITICEKEALKQAKEADKKILNSELEIQNSPLWGIPIAVKDLFCTKGIKTTAGSKVLENYIPVYDATVVKRLKEAGAIIIGKTNLDAWGHGSSGENSSFGPTKNPYDQDRVPGGSSSGSAVAVSAHECIAALGTDTGGSIRLPASFCGVVGLKPTYGLVSRYGVIAMASSLDCIGHFSKTVADSAQILQITAGRDQYDSTTIERENQNYLNFEKEIQNLKIGLPRQYFKRGVNKKVLEVFKRAVSLLEKLGGEIIEISLPHTKYALAAYYIIQPSEVSSNLARYDGIRYGFGRNKFEDEAKRRIMLGTFTLSTGYYEAYYLRAMKVRTLIIKEFEEAFQKVDVIITPVSPDIPFKLGEKINNPLKMYLSDVFTIPASLAGVPALSLPAGRIGKLPVGIQIIGKQFSEKLLFRVGYVLEQIIKNE